MCFILGEDFSFFLAPARVRSMEEKEWDEDSNTYRFVWSRIMPILMKQPRSSFLERKWAIVEQGNVSRGCC